MDLGWVVTALQQQHENDLKLYQSAHNVWSNRCLHWIMIPVETASFALFTICIFVIAVTTTTTTKDVKNDYGSDNSDNNEYRLKRRKMQQQQKQQVMNILQWHDCMGVLWGLLCIVLSCDTHGLAAALYHAVVIPVWIRALMMPRPLDDVHDGDSSNRHWFIINFNNSNKTFDLLPTLKRSMLLALYLWTISWTLQIAIGHWYWEGNQPNLWQDHPWSSPRRSPTTTTPMMMITTATTRTTDDAINMINIEVESSSLTVSLLAVFTSVLIAWKS